MIKKISVLLVTLSIIFTFTSCQSHSEKNIHELIKKLNSEYQYDFNDDDFITEKKENIVYHKMTDSKTILSFYCNKNGEIIQSTLSSFDIDNADNCQLISAIGSILTDEKAENIKPILTNSENNTNFQKNNWHIYIIRNSLGITYVISKENSESSCKPTLKNKIEQIN